MENKHLFNSINTLSKKKFILKDANFRAFSVILGLIIFTLWISFYAHYTTLDLSSNNLGDAFGALNTLFSGLAFAGVILAIILQHKELTDTRKELQRQANSQSIAAKLQAFSSLITHYENIKKQSDESSQESKNAQLKISQLKDNIEQISHNLAKIETPKEKELLFKAVIKIFQEKIPSYKWRKMSSIEFEGIFKISKNLFDVNVKGLTDSNFDVVLFKEFAQYLRMNEQEVYFKYILPLSISTKEKQPT